MPLTIQRPLKTSFDSRPVKRFQTSVKSSREHFYHIFFLIVRRNDLENISVIEFEIIGVFANTWTADYKYPVTDCENLPFPIQIQLS